LDLTSACPKPGPITVLALLGVALVDHNERAMGETLFREELVDLKGLNIVLVKARQGPGQVEAEVLPSGAHGGRAGRNKGKTDEVVDRAVDAATRAGRRKVDDLLRGGVKSGSPAHNLARKWNAARGKTPKAYVHIRTAEKLTKIGKVASTATAFLVPVGDLKGVVDNLRRGYVIKKQREKIRTAYSDQARTVVGDQREAIRAHIEIKLHPRHEAKAATLESADESARARTQARARWGALSEQAQELAAVIDQALAR
jgi:hypothetical protein